MYSRFTALQEYTEEHQKRLEELTVAVVGLGATGSAIAENLARHGVDLILVDRDYLERKDVYSSGLYNPVQCKNSLPKAEASKKILGKFTEVEAYSTSLNGQNIDLVSSADLVMDGTDNLEARQVLNDFSKKEDVPWIYTAAIADTAYSMLFEEKCFNCMIEKPQQVATCETDGILREVSQIAAAKSTKKAVEFLTGKNVDESLEVLPEGRVLDVETSGCEVCNRRNYPHLEKSSSVSTVCGDGKYQLKKDFDFDQAKNIDAGEVKAENGYLVRINFGGRDVAFFNSGRVIVEAEDEGHAESTVSELLGI